jgi:hypothetical protein
MRAATAAHRRFSNNSSLVRRPMGNKISFAQTYGALDMAYRAGDGLSPHGT